MIVDVYRLENGEFYDVCGTLSEQGTEYLLLVNENDDKDICLRKLIKRGNLDCISQLSEEEFDSVLDKFSKKYENIFD